VHPERRRQKKKNIGLDGAYHGCQNYPYQNEKLGQE